MQERRRNGKEGMREGREGRRRGIIGEGNLAPMVISEGRQNQGRSQKFVSEGDKTGGLGAKVPQRGPGAEPWWGSGASPRS